MTYAFGEFVLDERLYQLRRNGAVVKLEPKVFDVLAHLIRHRARVVSKDELLETLWPDEFVSESVLPRCIAAARRALADTRRAPSFIATVHGRGYRFLAPVSESEAAPALDPAATRPRGGMFVGRDAALAELHGALDDAGAGAGRLLLLAGEPGIGKTRTAEEIGLEAARRGFRVAVGRCYEDEGAPAFWPWVQILRACIRERDAARLAAELGPGAADIATLIPELRQRMAELTPTPRIAAEQARFRLFDSISAFLQRSSAAAPILVVVDDLHCADPSSLHLLQFLSRELRHAHLLVIAAYRDVAVRRDHPLAQALAALTREPTCGRIILRGLEEPDVRRFVDEVAGHTVDDALVAAVHRLTEGNPFFIGEMVRWLAAQDRLHPGAGATVAWGVDLPQGIREAVGRRLAALSAECNDVLGVAAAIGRELPLALLAAVVGSDRRRVLELLDEAAAARIIHSIPSGLGAYAFSHALIRQTLYEELTVPRRVLLHLRIAETLQALYRDDLEPHLAQLAHHLFHAAPAGNVDTAIDYSVRAAQRSARLLAYEEAAAHYGRALQLLELAPVAATGGDATAVSARRCELLLARGGAHADAGQREHSQECCREAAALARRLGRADLLARAALAFGQRAELGPQPAEELRVLLDDAARELPEEAGALRARVMSRLAGTAPYHQSLAVRTRLSHDAVELARRSRDVDALFDALGARLWALLGPDGDDERMRVCDEVAALVERTGQIDRMLLVHEHRIRCALSVGDMTAADEHNRRYEALAGELRQPVFLFLAEFYRVGRALGDGRFADADTHIERGITLGRRLHHPSTDAILIWQIYWLLRERREMDALPATLQARHEQLMSPDLAARAASDFNDQGATLAERYGITPAFEHAAAVYWQAESGQTDAARQGLIDLSAHDFADIPRDEWWTATMTLLAEVCMLLDDGARAAPLYALLAPFAAKNAAHHLVRTYGGAIAHFLGVLARTMGDAQTAAAHFDLALAMNARMGARPAVVRTQYEYARLLARGGAADRRRGRDLRSEALRTATALGMTGFSRRLAARE